MWKNAEKRWKNFLTFCSWGWCIYTHTHIYMYIFIAADAAEWQVLFTIEKQTKQNKKQAKIYILSAKMT